MTLKERMALVEKFRKQVNGQKRECLHKGCNQQAIQSHLLQKNGLLTQIAEDGKVFAITPNMFKEERMHFKEIGINDAFTFPGFCELHDNNLFKVIESGKQDFENYQAQLLLSYRARLNEQRKKEIAVDWLKKFWPHLRFKWN